VENKCQDIVEGPAASRTEEKTTDSLHADAVGALATLRSFACTYQKRRKRHTYTGYSGQAALRREQCSVHSKPEEMAIAKEWLGKHACAATNTRTQQ
jgi:hypothetical protein